VIVRKVVGFLDDRLGASRFARSVLNKVFPDHWSFMLGEVALYCFVVLLGTGTFLAFFFKPSSELVRYAGSYPPLRGVGVSEAFRSVLNLSFDVRAGMVMRQTHHWAAVVFIAAIVAHLARVFFTGAFRRPREINWMVGLTLMILAIFNGFTGYSLPDDLLSGTGLRIAYSIALSIPLVGTWVAFLLFGGEFPANDILSRLFVIHVMLIPGLIVALLGLHMAVLWRQKHTQFAGPGRTETNVVGSRLWPSYAAKSLGLFLAVAAVLAALGGLAQINPVWLYGPFRPSAVSSPAQPDWYLGWMEGALRLFPPIEIRAFGYTIANPFFPAVVFPGITFTMLYLWPFIEQLVSRDRARHELLDRPRDRPTRTALGVGTLTFYAVLMLAGANDVLARRLGVPVDQVSNGLRVLLFVLPVIAMVLTRQVARSLAAAVPSGPKAPRSRLDEHPERLPQ
jgi:quinol---cytochrome-c reductase cytochrome b subunit